MTCNAICITDIDMKDEATLTIRLSRKLLEEMHKEADRQGLTLSAWLRLIAQEKIARRKK